MHHPVAAGVGIRRVADQRARVAAVDRSPEGLAALAEQAAAGERLSTHVVDITDGAAVAALPAAVEAAHGIPQLRETRAFIDGVLDRLARIQP